MSTDTPPGDRIAKVIARAGLASRREAERMIEEGRIAVNGEVVTSPALNVSDSDRITLDGALIGPAEEPRLWMYHKPAGLVTTTKDEQGRKTIFDELPEELPRVMSVGRLDLNSEGLLLLTNDGEIKRKLELPSTGWLRRYRVRVNGRPTDPDLQPLRDGITVDGQSFQPMIVTLDRQQGANAWLTVGLREGKNREIRRAMADIGLNVNRLIRISYGPFQLGQMAQGEVIEVRRKIMRDQLGLEPAPEADTTGAKPKPRVQRSRKPGTAAAAMPAVKPSERGGPRRTAKPKRGVVVDESYAPTRGAGGGRGKPVGKPGGKPGGPKAGDKAGDKTGAKFGPKSGPKSGPSKGPKPGPRGGKPAGGAPGRPVGGAPHRGRKPKP